MLLSLSETRHCVIIALMSSTVEQIKEKLSIEEVVSQYTKLQPSGVNMKARCPFHSERTPSFMISPERQTYHCFGCGVGGDIFSFIEAIEGVDFKGALKILADKAGVEIVYDKTSKDRTSEKDTAFAVMAAATDFFVKNLNQNESAKKYLRDRGLSDKTIKEFKVGFAIESWDALLTHLTAKGFDQKDIESVGLVLKSPKSDRYYDRFRSRIMFPIADSAGRVVAFSGRIFNNSTSSGQSASQIAKYINSPETLLYSKSKVLYGYDRARQAIRRNDFAIVVEGQMDLLMSHQAGYGNTVAISGTALTHEHITLLSRMSKNLILALDGDEAGLKSASKSAREALVKGFDVKLAKLPDGADPADIIKGQGKEGWKNIIKNAKHIVDFLLDLYISSIDDDRKRKLEVEKNVFPYLNLIQSNVDREHFVGVISARLGISTESINKSLSVNNPEEIGDNDGFTKADIKHDNLDLAERLVAIQIWKKDEDLKNDLIDILTLEKFTELEGAVVGREQLFFELEKAYEEPNALRDDVESFLFRLRSNALDKELEDATAKMRGAEAANDEESIKKYLNICNELSRKRVELESVNAQRSV